MRIIAFVVVLALAALPATALAQPASQPAAPSPPSAEKAAAKSSGDITRDQYIERAKQQAEARFDRMDADHDGVLTREEMRAYRSSHHRRSRSAAKEPAAAPEATPPKQQ